MSDELPACRGVGHIVGVGGKAAISCQLVGHAEMRNTVNFRSSLFENKEPKPHFINPCCFGEDLVSWLLRGLQGTSLSLGDSVQEDYGWGFWVEGDYWVAVGVMDDSIGVENPQWVVAVDYDAGLNVWKRLFGKADSPLQLKICEAINSVLRDEPKVTEISWCNEPETDCGENPG